MNLNFCHCNFVIVIQYVNLTLVLLSLTLDYYSRPLLFSSSKFAYSNSLNHCSYGFSLLKFPFNFGLQLPLHLVVSSSISF